MCDDIILMLCTKVVICTDLNILLTSHVMFVLDDVLFVLYQQSHWVTHTLKCNHAVYKKMMHETYSRINDCQCDYYSIEASCFRP